MKNLTLCNITKLVAVSAILFLVPLVASSSFEARAEGNTISGHIFGIERTQLYDVNVELLNDYLATVKRTRTDGSGRYFFSGMGPGRYTVRVMPYETDYEEEEESVEIVNFTRENQNGERSLSGFQNEMLDFHLKLRRGASGITGAVFVQSDIPPAAKKLYEKAVEDLNGKDDKEGLAELKAAIELFPKYFAALERLGSEYVRLKHFEAAQILLQLAVNENPRSFRAMYGLAYALNSLNKTDEADIAIIKAITIYSGSPEAMLLMGVIDRSKKRYSEAEKHLLQAKELAKTPVPDIHWNLALLYGNNMKKYREAARELRLYLKVSKNVADEERIKKLIVTYEEKAKTS